AGGPAGPPPRGAQGGRVVGERGDGRAGDEAPAVMPQADGSFFADARASLEDVTATLGAEFDVGDAADEVDTLGGYLFMKIGRVPVRGELVSGPGDFEIEVFDADPRRLKRLRIYRAKGSSAGGCGQRGLAGPDAAAPAPAPAPLAGGTPPPGLDAKIGEPSSPGGSH